MSFHKKIGHKQESGSVLIIALLLVAVIAAISTQILVRGRIEIDQASQIALNDRIYLDLQGYQYWAIQTIGSYPEKEGFVPAAFNPQTFEGGAAISGGWQDQQGLFNLNALPGDANLKAGFIRLLQSIQPGMDTEEAERILSAIQAYLAKVDKMVSVSELRGINGVSQPLYLAMEKYVTALPTKRHEINMNAVDPKDPRVLLTVFNKPVSIKDIQSLMICREHPLIQKKSQFDEFLNCLHKKNAVFQKDQLTYFSRYFLAIGKVKIGLQQHVLYSFLEREKDGDGRAMVRLLWQSLDTR